MNNAVTTFKYNGTNEVRTITNEQTGEPWWVAKDVCDCLGYKNPSEATKYLDEDERSLINNPSGMGGSKTTIINEPGLYSLILRSRKPEAKAFKRWVTHEVLPEIRKTGSFNAQPKELTRMEILTLAMESEQRALIAEAQVEVLAPKAEVADDFLNAEGLQTIAQVAQHVDLGQKRLFAFLRDRDVLIDGGDRHNQPYQCYVKQGYFKLVSKPYYVNGYKNTNSQTQVTPRGMEFISKLLRNFGAI